MKVIQPKNKFRFEDYFINPNFANSLTETSSPREKGFNFFIDILISSSITGKIKYEDGSQYEGDIKNGKSDGIGKNIQIVLEII